MSAPHTPQPPRLALLVQTQGSASAPYVLEDLRTGRRMNFEAPHQLLRTLTLCLIAEARDREPSDPEAQSPA
jgi:hypothetical protein